MSNHVLRIRQLFIALSVAATSLVLVNGKTHAQAIGFAEAYTLHGDVDDSFGIAVDGVGDVDGDGIGDLVVGASGASDETGYVRVVSGQTGSEIYTTFGDGIDDRFGNVLSGVGDVNGDGINDIIVAAPETNDFGSSQGGYVRVLDGSNGSTIFTVQSEDSTNRFFGRVSSADVNGDGFSDVIIGESENDTVRVYSGVNGSELFELTDGGSFGNAVSGLGDLNGDGFDEFVVGNSFGSSSIGAQLAGTATVFSGVDGTEMFQFDGASGTRLGNEVGNAGDVNGDGIDDVIAASIFGGTSVFSGADGAGLLDFSYGSASFLGFGSEVDGLGDIDGDGFDDLLVTSVEDSLAHIISGRDGSQLFQYEGDPSGTFFGISARSTGDLNGDGVGDFVVGSSNGGLNDGGYARVYFSQVAVPEPTATIWLSLAFSVYALRRKKELSS